VTVPSTGFPPAARTEPDPELIALTVQACPLVAGLHGGAFGEVATYLPGRRVVGVRVGDARVEIHVVGRYPASMAQIAGQIRNAIVGLSGAAVVDVTIEDVAELGEDVPDALASGGPIRSDGPARTSGPRAGAPVLPPADGCPTHLDPGRLAPVHGTTPVAARPPATGFDSKESAL